MFDQVADVQCGAASFYRTFDQRVAEKSLFDGSREQGGGARERENETKGEKLVY